MLISRLVMVNKMTLSDSLRKYDQPSNNKQIYYQNSIDNQKESVANSIK